MTKEQRELLDRTYLPHERDPIAVAIRAALRELDAAESVVREACDAYGILVEEGWTHNANSLHIALAAYDAARKGE